MASLKPRRTLPVINLSQISFGRPTWYHNLPSPILLKIFSFLTEKELLTQVAPVCRKWRYVASNPALWNNFCAIGGEVPTFFICHKLRTYNNLTTVRLSEISEPVVVIRQISRCLPNLKNLALRNSGIVNESCLRNLIKRCKQLESLDFNGTRFKAERFYQEIAGLTNLKSINFSKNIFLNVHNLLSVVLNCHKLEELKLSSFIPLKPEKSLGDEDVSFIVTNLAPGLKSLTLDASNLTNYSFKTIMQCSKLEKLGLYAARNLSSDVFVNMSKHLQNLRTLKIREAHFLTGTNIAELFNCGKASMENLTSIDFTGCWKITDVGIKAIAQCCLKLEDLRLKSCKSIENLSPITENCLKLKLLNVAFCINLNLNTIFPLPEQFKTLVIDKGSRFQPAIKDLFNKDNLIIKMCLSEYNKEIEYYKPNT